MYRTYENPWNLEKQLEDLDRRIAEENDEDALIDLHLDRAELVDRINFAWQDDEYDTMYADGEFER